MNGPKGQRSAAEAALYQEIKEAMTPTADEVAAIVGGIPVTREKDPAFDVAFVSESAARWL